MTDLVRYDAMCRAIDAAYEVDEVKAFATRRRTFEVYAHQAKNVEAERRDCETRAVEAGCMIAITVIPTIQKLLRLLGSDRRTANLQVVR